jgi:hypothetical protein
MKSMDEKKVTELMAKRRELEWYLDGHRDYEKYEPKAETDLQNERLVIYTKTRLPEELLIPHFMDERIVNLVAKVENKKKK